MTGLTVHGFRSAFKDLVRRGHGHAENAVVEAALAHVVGDKVEAAYRRGDLFTKRAKLMADWAQYLRQQARRTHAAPGRWRLTEMKQIITCLLLLIASPAVALEADWQRVYCAGMELEHELPSGGRIDCFNADYAIEVEWAQHWAEAVGQSLYYASATNRKPGIILLWEQSEGPVGGSRRSYVYRLEYAPRFVKPHVYVWTCAIDKDRTLDDCFRPAIQLGEAEPQTWKEDPLLRPLPPATRRPKGIGD